MVERAESKGEGVLLLLILLVLQAVAEEVDKMMVQNPDPESSKQEKTEDSLVTQILRWSTLHPLLLTMYLHLLQNWCGVNVIVFKVGDMVMVFCYPLLFLFIIIFVMVLAVSMWFFKFLYGSWWLLLLLFSSFFSYFFSETDFDQPTYLGK